MHKHKDLLYNRVEEQVVPEALFVPYSVRDVDVLNEQKHNGGDEMYKWSGNMEPVEPSPEELKAWTEDLNKLLTWLQNQFRMSHTVMSGPSFDSETEGLPLRIFESHIVKIWGWKPQYRQLAELFGYSEDSPRIWAFSARIGDRYFLDIVCPKNIAAYLQKDFTRLLETECKHIRRYKYTSYPMDSSKKPKKTKKTKNTQELNQNDAKSANTQNKADRPENNQSN